MSSRKSSVGLVNSPLEDGTPLRVAEALLAGRFKEDGVPTLYEDRGRYWVWDEGEWQIKDRWWVEDQIYAWMDGKYYAVAQKNAVQSRRLEVTRHSVGEVLRALDTLVRMRPQKTPAWLGKEGEGPVDPEKVIAFQDVLLDVQASAEKGEVVLLKRDMRWFDAVTLPVKWNPEAKCEVWEKVTMEWGAGDPEWVELLEREMGYTLMAWRGLERWFLHWGKVRAGKGTIEDVRALLLRSPHAAMSCEPMRLTEGFEILQLKDARVAVLTEFGNLDNRAGLPVAGQVKRLVGRDPLHLKVKNGQPVTVKSQAAVVAMANEMPRLPNHGAGLSSKLVILPFLRSWEGKADSRIKDEYLPRELEGIAYRCALAAVRLVREPEVGKKFPVLKASQEALGVYTSEVSEADRFLGWAFEKGTGGVAFELVWGLYRQFCKAYSLAPKAGVKGLTRWLMRDGTWDLARKKTSHGVYVMGLRMKERPGLPEEDDELGSYGEECGEEFGGGEPE